MATSAMGQEPTDSPARDEQTRVITMRGTYYADKFVGRHTSNGEIFRQNQYTAAHKTIAFGTYLLVTNPATGKSVVVRVNDRCPKVNILDMTKIAVHTIGIKGAGPVEVTTLEPTMGHMLWAQQDTLAMTTDEYMAFRDGSKRRRISPYPHIPKNNGDGERKTAEKEPAGELIIEKETTPEQQDSIAQDIAEDQEEPTAPTTANQQHPQPTETGVALYDIELCTVGSQYGAWLEQRRLPKEMQDKVLLERNKQNQEIRIILVLAATRSHAVRTQAELIDLFPESCLIRHQK